MATAIVSSSNGIIYINPVVGTLTVPAGLIFLQHNMILTGTLTLSVGSELLVI